VIFLHTCIHCCQIAFYMGWEVHLKYSTVNNGPPQKLLLYVLGKTFDPFVRDTSVLLCWGNFWIKSHFKQLNSLTLSHLILPVLRSLADPTLVGSTQKPRRPKLKVVEGRLRLEIERSGPKKEEAGLIPLMWRLKPLSAGLKEISHPSGISGLPESKAPRQDSWSHLLSQ